MNEPSSHRAARFIGATLAGRYRIDGVLTETASGALLCGGDIAEHKRVAIRLIYREDAGKLEVRALLEREAAVAARIRHPAIAACRPVGTSEDGSTILVLPDLNGPTLRLVAADGHVPLARAAVIAKQLAIALEALHAAGIVHRALSPDCVHVLPPGVGDHEEVRISDFAFAKLDPASPGPRLEPGSIAAAYAAPEVLRMGDIDGSADFYALGLLFYEMVTGSRPDPGRMGSLPSMTSIRSVPAAVDALALRLLADDPSRRAAIAMDVVRALDALAEPAPVAPPAAPVSAPVTSSAPRSAPASASASAPASASASAPASASASVWARSASGARSSPDSTSAPASAVTSHVMSTSIIEDGNGSAPVGGLHHIPHRMRIYFGGTVAIVLLLAIAVIVRTAPADTDESPSDDRASPAAPATPEERPAAAASSTAESARLARELRVRIQKSQQTGNARASVADIEQLFDIDPTAASDRDVKDAMVEVLMRIMMGDGVEGERLFTVITTKMGPAGPDLLFELMTTKGLSRAAKRAEDLLRDEAVRSGGSKALQIAYDLRMARGCEDKAALFDRARDDGDRRTLGQLQLLNQQECRRGECCLANDPRLKAAMDGLKDRLK